MLIYFIKMWVFTHCINIINVILGENKSLVLWFFFKMASLRDFLSKWWLTIFAPTTVRFDSIFTCSKMQHYTVSTCRNSAYIIKGMSKFQVEMEHQTANHCRQKETVNQWRRWNLDRSTSGKGLQKYCQNDWRGKEKSVSFVRRWPRSVSQLLLLFFDNYTFCVIMKTITWMLFLWLTYCHYYCTHYIEFSFKISLFKFVIILPSKLNDSLKFKYNK